MRKLLLLAIFYFTTNTFSQQSNISNKYSDFEGNELRKINYQITNDLTIFLVFYSNRYDDKVLLIGNKDKLVNVTNNNILFIDDYIEFKENYKKGKIVTVNIPNKFFHKSLLKYTNPMLKELVLWDGIAEQKARKILESYLSIKHGISLYKKSNYYSSTKKKIWDAYYNKNFLYRVTGLGIDHNIKLNRLKGKNIDSDSLVIGIDLNDRLSVATLTNLKNPKYLIWGDNGESLSFNNKNELNRVWRYQKTNFEDNTFFNFTFTLEDDILKKYQYFLVFSKKEFKTEKNNLYYLNPDYIHNMLFGYNIKLDANNNNFTILRKPKPDKEFFSIFPNPAIIGNPVILKFNNLDIDSMIKIDVFDISGKIIYHKNYKTTNRKYNNKIIFKKTGVFLVRVQINNQIYTKKILVSK